MCIQGIWLPIITPFKGDSIDIASYKKLIDHYIDRGINGLIPLGTTGECPTIDDYEFDLIIEETLQHVNNRIPVYVGLGGNNTRKVTQSLSRISDKGVAGILSTCPYYNRPSQRGIYEHFKSIAESTDMNIVLYNIPYRTGRNIENETIYRLSEFKNIVALKDASGNCDQSTALLLDPPKDFSILTGDDMFFYNNLALGGQGGIMASAHLETENFVNVYHLMQENNHKEALIKWREISKFIPLLFEEPNPSPLKYILEKQGFIDSSSTRLPLTGVSETCKNKLNQLII